MIYEKNGGGVGGEVGFALMGADIIQSAAPDSPKAKTGTIFR